ncbi:MAG: plastocyanin [Planctomycetota bacterium]|jgi:plastocyanin
MRTLENTPWISAGIVCLACLSTGCLQNQPSAMALRVRDMEDSAMRRRASFETLSVAELPAHEFPDESIEAPVLPFIDEGEFVVTKPDPGPVALLAESIEGEAFDDFEVVLGIRGVVMDESTGNPLFTDGPVVVFALPREGSACASAGDASCDLNTNPVSIVMTGDEHTCTPFAVTSPGRSVLFENRDTICHNFFSSSGPNTFEIGMLRSGESMPVQFLYPGHVQIYCTLHSGKQMSVLVAPSHHFATADASGAFEIEGVPSGDYLLETWTEVFQPRQLQATVEAGESHTTVLGVNTSMLKETE